MKTKSSLGLTIATVSITVITAIVLVLSLISDNISSEHMLKNVFSDVILLVCVSLFAGIVLLRGRLIYNKEAQYEIN